MTKKLEEITEDALDQVAGGEGVSLNYEEIKWTYSKNESTRGSIGSPQLKQMERVFDDE